MSEYSKDSPGERHNFKGVLLNTFREKVEEITNEKSSKFCFKAIT